MELLIVTGLSGAGKSRATVVLEDMGYYCADNIPADMLPVLADICESGGPRYQKTAVVVDIRTLAQNGSGELLIALNRLRELNVNFSVMFLEASDQVILRRYKETRRAHPLFSAGETMAQAIVRERQIMSPVREMSDYIVDTSETTSSGLRACLLSILEKKEVGTMSVRILSFGYKYGIPAESDFVFDSRFLPNPFYIPELKELGGESEAIRDYLDRFPETDRFKKQLFDMVDFLLPRFRTEGRATLVFSVGCTGGQHRSVAMAEALKEYLSSAGWPVTVLHRDRKKNIQEIKGRVEG